MLCNRLVRTVKRSYEGMPAHWSHPSCPSKKSTHSKQESQPTAPNMLETPTTSPQEHRQFTDPVSKRHPKQSPNAQHANQNFSIMFFLKVHILARLPYTYMGMVVSRQAIWMPPMARKTFLAPEASSQWGKKREKTRPWKMSA